MYHERITKKFGQDLSLLLGPPDQRRPWADLSSDEQQRINLAIPVYVNTRSLGQHPSFIDIVCFCFNRLIAMGDENPLRGIDLPSWSSLEAACDARKLPRVAYGSALHPIDRLFKNAAKQRDVWLRHIFQDIIFQFNPSLVHPGIGRMDSKGRLFVNDAQHRTIACMILGIEAVPISYIESDDEYWDVAQYASININGLAPSEFDRWRVRYQRYIEAAKAGMEIDGEDRLCFEIKDVFDDVGITVVEKKDTGHGNSMVLTGIGNMIKYRREYGLDLFARATSINARLFPTSKVHTANCWGLMAFLKAQEAGPMADTATLDDAVFRSIKRRWPANNGGNSLHTEIKEVFTRQTGIRLAQSPVAEPLIISHGIWQVCRNYEPNIPWVEPMWSGAPGFVVPMIGAPHPRAPLPLGMPVLARSVP